MWVAPEYRRQGVGSRLIDTVIDWARAQGFSRLALDVADHNSAAVELYARHGFAPTGETASLPPPRAHIREHRRALLLRHD
jgi:ribosomal protein S18 acetylase RimI-like enzyme